MKKTIKWAGILLASLLVLLMLLEIGIYCVSRTQWFNTRVTNAVQQALGRDIELAKMGASLRGIFVEDLRVAEKGGFEQGTFAQFFWGQHEISSFFLESSVSLAMASPKVYDGNGRQILSDATVA